MRGRRSNIDWQEDEQTLYELYKREKDSQNRTRLQALWLMRQGRTRKEAAQIVGVHYRTIQTWVTWYRREGISGVLGRRHGGQGGKQAKISPEQEQALEEQAMRGDIRTIWDGVNWVKETFDVEYSYWGMRWIFRRLELRKKMPRQIAPQASLEEQDAWKKGA